MLAQLEPRETSFFRTLNQFVEPLVRVGVGSPGLLPTGVVILETVGRKSLRRFNVPLLATVLGDLVLVSTVRSRAQWIRNVAAEPRVRYWMLGRPREATAVVVAPGLETVDTPGTAQRVRCLASMLRPWSSTLGMSFAILAPVSKASPWEARAAGRTGAGVPGVRGEHLMRPHGLA
jgi:hypothetical protein